jgi:hypothetical protein
MTYFVVGYKSDHVISYVKGPLLWRNECLRLVASSRRIRLR